MLVDRRGTPLAIWLTPANVHDGQLLTALVDAVEPIHRPRGQARPCRRPDKLHADKAYSSRANRRAVRVRGITPGIARPGVESSERLGRYRWVVEPTRAWLGRFRRRAIRYERRAEASSTSAVHSSVSTPSSISAAARRS